ncbi:MAG: hypothetical protein ACXVIH_08590 [Ilumatobacteraceae bacterium]
MGNRGTNAIARLKKVQVEQLLGDYDADPVAALSAALRVVLDMPNDDWAELLAAAPLDAARRRLLLGGDASSLDHLAAELNERRDLTR